MMTKCRTLGEAFEKNERYQKIIGTLIGARIQLGLGKVKVILTVPKHAPALSRHCFESTLSSTVRLIRTLTGQDYHPLEVGFAYPAPASKAEYDRVFGCPKLRIRKRHRRRSSG